MMSEKKLTTVALVTGASSGIGEQFARQLAAQGNNLFLVARRADRLQELAAELSSKHNIQADYLALDLAEAGSRQRLHDEVAGRGYQVALLVNSAGFGTTGRFSQTPVARSMQMLRLNVDALVELTGLYVAEMVERSAGGIINIASTGAFQPIAQMAVYGASKALVLNFSLGLWAEVKDKGVQVLCLCPGYTNTEFASVASEPNNPTGSTMEASEVVQIALKALAKNEGYVIAAPGDQKFLASTAHLLPLRLAASLTERMFSGHE